MKKQPGWEAAGFKRDPSHYRRIICPICGKPVTNHGFVWPQHLRRCKAKQQPMSNHEVTDDELE